RRSRHSTSPGPRPPPHPQDTGACASPSATRRLRFVADVRIRCEQGGTPFRFIGLPAGLDLNGAAASVDGTEARLAIAPKGEVVTPIEGGGGFTVRGVPLPDPLPPPSAEPEPGSAPRGRGTHRRWPTHRLLPG